MAQTLSLNQFKQTPVKGEMAFTGQSAVLAGIISANESGTLYPGQRVTLDTVAGCFTPSFVSVAANAAAIGTILSTKKKSALAYATGDQVEVALCVGNCAIQWMEAGATFAVLTELEQTTGVTVQTKSSGKLLGLALDGASAVGQLVRVILTRTSL